MILLANSSYMFVSLIVFLLGVCRLKYEGGDRSSLKAILISRLSGPFLYQERGVDVKERAENSLAARVG
jgi:hypothetical protein